MTNKKFVVKLSGEERGQLSELISKGKAKAKTILKARILLKADQSEAGEGWADEEICRALDTNITMVARVREKLVTEGLDAVLTRKKRDTPPIEPIFDGIARGEQNFRRFAAVLNESLKDRTWLLGERLTIADFSVGGQVPAAEHMQLPLGEFPEIRRWYAGLMKLPAWQEAFAAKDAFLAGWQSKKSLSEG